MHKAKLAELEQKLTHADAKHAKGTRDCCVDCASCLRLLGAWALFLMPIVLTCLRLYAHAELRDARDEFEQQRTAQVIDLILPA